MKKVKKILAIGDSLALPGHGNSYEDTWIYLLKSRFSEYDFITYFKRQLTTDVLVSMGGGEKGVDKAPKGSDCLEFYSPDLVILQLGIVDCAPRLFKPNSLEMKVLNNLPEGLRNAYIRIMKKLRKRDVSKAYVTPERFRNNLVTYFNRCKKAGVQKVIYISICVPDENMTSKNPDIQQVVEHYNRIIDEQKKMFPFVISVDPLDSRHYEYEIFEDGYHPNQKGNEMVFKSLANVLS